MGEPIRLTSYFSVCIRLYEFELHDCTHSACNFYNVWGLHSALQRLDVCASSKGHRNALWLAHRGILPGPLQCMACPLM